MGQLEIALPGVPAARALTVGQEEQAAARALTPEQEQAAARRHGSLLLSAGAGSGKTSVLVERFVRAVLEDDTAPGRILAITFTERSAGELAERIRSRFLELGRRELARDTEAAFIGTFHGFCARLLGAHPLAAGLDPDFLILDEALAARLRLDAFRIALGDFLAGEAQAAVDLVAAFGADRLRATVLDVHAQLRSEGHTQPTLPLPVSSEDANEDGADRKSAALGEDPNDVDREGVQACALLNTLLRGFSQHYASAKSARGALDFDDLELRAGMLLREHPGVRSAWSLRFELLMVDEFQDTNPRQLAILDTLRRDNLFTVGDELQSIYGFRHADVSLFRARRAELAARGAALALTHNFRSHPHLLAAINAVFATRFGDAHTPLVAAGQRDGDPAPPAPIELLLTHQGACYDANIAEGLPAAPRWRQAEARLLAERLANIVAAGEASPGDIVVLLRALGDLPLYQRALEQRGLPTLASVGSFWGHQQIGDLLAYLRALANPLDEIALYSTLASPLVGLRSDTLAHISLAARAGRQGVWEMLSHEQPACLDAQDSERLQRFSQHFAHERTLAPQHTIAELLRRALNFSDYRSHLLSLPYGSRRLANVHKLLGLANRFEAQEGRHLRGFLDHVAHQLSDVLPTSEPEAPAGDGQNAIRLMTIHAAKGLEFPIVCLADLGRKPTTHRPDLLLDGSRLGLRLTRLDSSPAVPTLHYDDLLRERLHAEALEEQRIVYVALTRARQRLLLSAGVDFGAWPADTPGAAPIAWLAPALHPNLPALLAGQPNPVLQLHLNGAPEVRLRCLLNTPATLGSLPREESPHAVNPASRARAEPSFSAAASAHHARPARQVPTPPQPPAAAPSRHARPPSPQKPELVLSYTALSELERCGYRYYLERILGLPEDHSLARGHGIQGRLRGRLVHRLMQEFDFAAPRAPDVAAAARETGASLSAPEREEIAALVASLGGTPLAQRLAAIPRPHREHAFAFFLPPLVTGVFDLLAQDENGCLVVDYKSDRVHPHEDLSALVNRDYGAQRLVYALATLHHGAPRVEIIHWFLARPLEPITAVFLAADLPELERQLSVRAARARARGFAVSPAPHRGLCLTCPARAKLCSWDAAATLREHPPPSP